LKSGDHGQVTYVADSSADVDVYEADYLYYGAVEAEETWNNLGFRIFRERFVGLLNGGEYNAKISLLTEFQIFEVYK
jgi:hypothetical protein